MQTRRIAGVVCGADYCRERRVRAWQNIPRRRERADCRNAVFVCDARQPFVLFCRFAGDFDLACFFALPADGALRTAWRTEKNSRKGRGAPCGVCVFPIGAFGDRAYFLSRVGIDRVKFFSSLYFLRVSFPEERPKNTLRRQARREYTSRS